MLLTAYWLNNTDHMAMAAAASIKTTCLFDMIRQSHLFPLDRASLRLSFRDNSYIFEEGTFPSVTILIHVYLYCLKLDNSRKKYMLSKIHEISHISVHQMSRRWLLELFRRRRSSEHNHNFTIEYPQILICVEIRIG